MAAAVADGMTVPACLLFNESPERDWVIQAVDAGFDLVMYSDDAIPVAERVAAIRAVVGHAHRRGAAVEAELEALPGVAGDLAPGTTGGDLRLTDPREAHAFVEATGID